MFSKEVSKMPEQKWESFETESRFIFQGPRSEWPYFRSQKFFTKATWQPAECWARRVAGTHVSALEENVPSPPFRFKERGFSGGVRAVLAHFLPRSTSFMFRGCGTQTFPQQDKEDVGSRMYVSLSFTVAVAMLAWRKGIQELSKMCQV